MFIILQNMKTFITSLSIIVTCFSIHAQSIYSQAFGDPTNPALIFLHGGPGYNSSTFEFTTAQKLADEGFYVVVYDRRGEGRSTDPQATFTFKETFDDLTNLYQKYHLKKASLLGHSFGGIVATLYAEKHREKVNSIVLIGAPVSLQSTFKTIIKTCKAIYTDNNDTENLKYIQLLENMDTSSIEYSSYCFMHAMQNGFYTPKVISQEAQTIYALFGANEQLKLYAMQMTYEGPQGFWKNEQYTAIDLTSHLNHLLEQHLPIYGMYGKDDGLYAAEQVNDLQALIGKEALHYFDHCSHSVFIDQQTLFIDALKNWIK